MYFSEAEQSQPKIALKWQFGGHTLGSVPVKIVSVCPRVGAVRWPFPETIRPRGRCIRGQVVATSRDLLCMTAGLHREIIVSTAVQLVLVLESPQGVWDAHTQ